MANLALAQKAIADLADKISKSTAKKIVDFLQHFDIYENRVFQVWELVYICGVNGISLTPEAEGALAQACKVTGSEVPFKAFATELKEANRKIDIGTLAAVSRFKGKIKEPGCAKAMNAIVVHAKKNKVGLPEVFDKLFGKEPVYIDKAKFVACTKELSLSGKEPDELFNFLDLAFHERINKLQFVQALKTHELPPSMEIEEENPKEQVKFEQIKQRPASAISAADVELQKSMIHRLRLYVLKEKGGSVSKMFEEETVAVGSRKGIPFDKFIKLITSALKADSFQVDTFAQLMKLQGQTDAKEPMVDFQELVEMTQDYKNLNVEDILEKLRVFVIETGVDLNRELRVLDFDQSQTISYQDFEKGVCTKLHTGLTRQEALRLSVSVEHEAGKMHYGKLTSNLENYSVSKSKVEANDPHFRTYEIIRKHLKRNRQTLFKLWGLIELAAPGKQPIKITKVDFKNSLSQFQGIQEKKIEAFIKTLLVKGGREVDFLMFAHKVGYVAAQEETIGLGTSIDLGKSTLLGLSQVFGSRDEMKRKFYTELLKVMKIKGIPEATLFLKEDAGSTGLVSRVGFSYVISNTFANTEAADTWLNTEMINSVADQFKMEGSEQIRLKSFFEKLGVRRAELYSLNVLFDQFYKQLNFKQLDELYDLFRQEDADGSKTFSEPQILAVFKAHAISCDSLQQRHFFTEFAKPGSSKVVEFNRIKIAYEDWMVTNNKPKKPQKRPLKQVLTNFYELIKAASERDNCTVQKLFQNKTFIPSFHLGRYLPELPPQDQERIIKEFDVNNSNQASLAEITKRYKIHFGIKDDQGDAMMKQKMRQEAFKIACKVTMKAGVSIKSLFKQYQITNSPGKCRRGDFMNVLENKLGLAKQTNPEVLEEIATDFETVVGINYENFAVKVHSYAFQTKEQENLYRKLSQYASRHNFNIQRSLEEYQKESGFIDELGLLNALTSVKFQISQAELGLMVLNVEKNREGSAYNHATIALLIHLAGGAAPTQETSRQKTIRFLRKLVSQVNQKGNNVKLCDDLDAYFSRSTEPTVEGILPLLGNSTGWDETRLRKLTDRYIVNGAFKGNKFYEDIEKELKKDALDGGDSLIEIRKKVEAIGPGHRRTLESIADHIQKNSISIFGAFNKADNKGTGLVKDHNTFANSLKNLVPVKVKELKDLASRYGKKQVQYKLFFQDLDAFKQLMAKPTHHSSIDPLEQEKRAPTPPPDSFKTPTKPPPEAQGLTPIQRSMGDLSKGRKVGIEQDLRGMMRSGEFSLPRSKVEEYFKQTIAPDGLERALNYVESVQPRGTPSGQLDFLALFSFVYRVNDPQREPDIFLKKVRNYFTEANISMKKLLRAPKMTKREIREAFHDNGITADNKQFFVLLDLSGVPLDSQYRYDTASFIQKLGVEEEDDQPLQSQKPSLADVEKNLQMIAGWMVEEYKLKELDVPRALTRYQNSRGQIAIHDMQAFMKRELQFELKDDQAGYFFEYVTGNPRASSVSGRDFVDALRRLNPDFDNVCAKILSGKAMGASKGGVSETPTYKQAKTNLPSSKKIDDIYIRLVQFCEEKGISFRDLTGGQTMGKVRMGEIVQWLQKIGFAYSQEEIESLAYPMELDGSQTLENLSMTPFKAKIYETSYAFFRPRDLTTPEEAKREIEKWPKRDREIFAKFSSHLAGRKIDSRMALQTMNQRIAGPEESVDGLLDLEVFVRGVYSLNFLACEDTDKVSIFKGMDVLRNNVISEEVFGLFLDAAQSDVVKAGVSTDFEEDIKSECMSMFQQMTAKFNFKMKADQLKRAFVAIGEYKTDTQLQELIRTYGSEDSLSQKEFLPLMVPILRKKIEEQRQSFERMRAFFRAADSDHNNVLSEQEFVKVLKDNFRADLTPQEFHTLMSEIDLNEDGNIDIDEFISFMEVGLEFPLSEKSKNALLFIRQACKYKPSNFVRYFMESPQNFRESFFAEQYSKRNIFPACVYQPDFDPTSLTFTDLLLNKALREKGATIKVTSKKKLDQVFKATKLRPLETTQGALLTLSSATYVPTFKSPEERKHVMKAVVRIGIMDARNNFQGNSTFVPAIWSAANPYSWKFSSSSIPLNGVLFRTTSQTFRDLYIIFEFVLYYCKGGDRVEMSCGWTKLKVSELTTSKKHPLPIMGGSPFGETQIVKADTRKKISWWNKNRFSKLYVSVKPYRYLNSDSKMHIDYLPETCLVNQKLLLFASGFRHYLAEHVLQEDALHNLRQGNPVIQVFMKVMNNPDITEFLAKHWPTMVVAKMTPKEQKPGDILMQRVEDTIYKLYAAIYKTDFKYTEGDPTQSALLQNNGEQLFIRRGDLIASALRQSGSLISRQRHKEHAVDFANEMGYKPFSVNQLIFDPFQGIGMQKLIEKQFQEERKVVQQARSRGASPENRPPVDDADLPDVPENIVNQIFGGLQASINDRQPIAS